MSPVPPHSLSSGSFKAFLHLVSLPWKPSLWNSTSTAHKSTPTQPPSLLRALESNFLLIKFTIKAPLMPTSATLPFCFFSSISLYIILISSWAVWNTVYWHNENSLFVYCSSKADTNIGALLSGASFFKYLHLLQGNKHFLKRTSVTAPPVHDPNMDIT